MGGNTKVPTGMRIVHVVAPAGIGGLERVVHGLAAGQVRSGHAVQIAAVVTAEEPVRPWLDELRRSRIEVELLELSARSYCRERRAIAALCRRFSAHVVHTHGFRPDVVDGPVAQREGIPCVTTVHGMTSECLRTRMYEWIQQRALRRFDAIVSVSRPLGARLLRSGVPASRVHVVPNAWCPTEPPLTRAEARRELGLPEEGWLIGWVGRLSREKGPDIALDAFTRLRNLPIGLSILGDGPLASTLRSRVREEGLAKRVRFHGTVRGAARVLPAFDAWILTSRTEGTPIALLEAMAAGVPIIATRVGGVPDVITEREAVLVPPSDPSALATAIRGTFEDRDAAAARTRVARERLATRYGSESWLARYSEIYRSLHRTHSISR